MIQLPKNFCFPSKRLTLKVYTTKYSKIYCTPSWSKSTINCSECSENILICLKCVYFIIWRVLLLVTPTLLVLSVSTDIMLRNFFFLIEKYIQWQGKKKKKSCTTKLKNNHKCNIMVWCCAGFAIINLLWRGKNHQPQNSLWGSC